MKTELKAKYLQHLVKKNNGKGFTLIELLVVIIIIGILAAIALPSFLNQAAKARQSEAKQTVGAVNRAQQAYRLEKPVFASSFSQLEIGLPKETNNYTYTVGTATAGTATILATPPAGGKSLRAASGGVAVTDKGLTSAGACLAKEVTTAAAVPTFNTAAVDPAPVVVCPGGYDPMT